MIFGYPKTGTPLDAVPVPEYIFIRSLRVTHSLSIVVQSLLHPSPYWIHNSIYFINYSRVKSAFKRPKQSSESTTIITDTPKCETSKLSSTVNMFYVNQSL